MKLEKLSLTIAAALALGLASCSKNEPATLGADDAKKADTLAADADAKTADVAKAEAEKAADAAKADAEKAVDAAKIEAAKAPENATIQGLIDKAKSLVAVANYADASTILQQLTGKTLSADQTTLVADLKEQIQKALAAKAAENAAGNVGNLLKK